MCKKGPNSGCSRSSNIITMSKRQSYTDACILCTCKYIYTFHETMAINKKNCHNCKTDVMRNHNEEEEDKEFLFTSAD